jgi:hypothetical protein
LTRFSQSVVYVQPFCGKTFNALTSCSLAAARAVVEVDVARRDDAEEAAGRIILAMESERYGRAEVCIRRVKGKS